MKKTLLLLSTNLNTRYLRTDMDDVYVITTDEQFRLFTYHQTRIVLHQSAAIHFAQEHQLILRQESSYQDIANSLSKTEIYLYDPVDVDHKQRIVDAFSAFSVHFLPDINFFHLDPNALLSNPPYKLDPLYRKWRQQHNILMENQKPVGGKFSFDTENRKTAPKQWDVPQPPQFNADDITLNVIGDVASRFSTHPSSSVAFEYPVTRDHALATLNHFITYRLPYFGDHQDAMLMNEPWMAHSLLSSSINLGLLFVDEVVHAVEQADAPIAAREGFIRQVLGWREYIRAIYVAQMPSYITHNSLNHHHPLPPLMYTAATSMNCLANVVQETIDHAYNHHIQRLMILGNITTLLGVDPNKVREWFNEMYVDSFDWVVTPNVMGMASYADGGLMSTKPYVASANYINKMSNYCKGCKFDPTQKTGENACPVNVWYYDFLDRHQDILATNPRMVYMYSNYRKLPETTLHEIKKTAQRYRQEVLHGTL
jgi:deoxyribodipyrimidine photolyase-related protein